VALTLLSAAFARYGRQEEITRISVATSTGGFMNHKRAFAIGPSTFASAVAFAAAMVSTASAQNVTAVSGTGSSRIDLAPHAATVTFVASNASTAQEALRSAAVSAAEGKAAVAIASKALPIPIVGALPVEGALRVFGKLRKHTVKGFNVMYLAGLSAETTVSRDGVSFTVPASVLQGGSPTLLRVKPSAKDSARIVRSVHVSVGPATPEVLGADQEAIPCRQEASATGDVVLTPNSPLGIGEYAIVLVPDRSPADDSLGGLAWDFRVR